jgi:hypothetical protein
VDTLSVLLTVAAGLILLFAGRRAFWLAAAMSVFVFAFPLLERWLGTGIVGLLVAAVIAAGFAVLAVNFLRAMSFLVGALAGAVALPFLLGLLGVDMVWWLASAIGALLGIFILGLALNWGLLVMTSWLGAHVVSEQFTPLFDLAPTTAVSLFFILLVAGVVVQITQVNRRRF